MAGHVRHSERVRVDMREVADGVWQVTGTDTNWALLAEGRQVTLVDAGYPGDLPRVLASLERIGRTPADVVAILLTHAHPDHLGGSERLRREHGIPVRVSEREAPHARGEVVQQVSEPAILRSAWRPSVLLWAARIVRAGGARVERIAEVQPFATGAALDLPGRPVPVPTPGHTDGHCAFSLPDRGVLLTGDALATGHATSTVDGPQLLPRMFHHDEAAAVASLEALRGLPGDVVVPGHGPTFRGSPADAVERALARRRAGRSG